MLRRSQRPRFAAMEIVVEPRMSCCRRIMILYVGSIANRIINENVLVLYLNRNSLINVTVLEG